MARTTHASHGAAPTLRGHGGTQDGSGHATADSVTSDAGPQDRAPLPATTAETEQFCNCGALVPGFGYACDRAPSHDSSSPGTRIEVPPDPPTFDPTAKAHHLVERAVRLAQLDHERVLTGADRDRDRGSVGCGFI